MPIVHMLADDRVGANRAVLVHLENVMTVKSWGEVPLYKITSSNSMGSKKLRKGALFRTTLTIFMFFHQHHHHDHHLLQENLRHVHNLHNHQQHHHHHNRPHLFQENLRHVHVVEEVDQLLAARWSVVLASLKKNLLKKGLFLLSHLFLKRFLKNFLGEL